MSDWDNIDDLEDLDDVEIEGAVDNEEKEDVSESEDVVFKKKNKSELKFKPSAVPIYKMTWKFESEDDKDFLISLVKPYCGNIANCNLIINQLQKFSNSKEEFYSKIYDFCSYAESMGMQAGYDLIKNEKSGWEHEVFAVAKDGEDREIAKLLYPTEVVEGIFTCPRCKNKKTQHYSVQLRKADEPPTTFIHCINSECRFKWREG